MAFNSKRRALKGLSTVQFSSPRSTTGIILGKGYKVYTERLHSRLKMATVLKRKPETKVMITSLSFLLEVMNFKIRLDLK